MKETLIIDEKCTKEKLSKIIEKHYFNGTIRFFTTGDMPKIDEYFWYEIEANLLFILKGTIFQSKLAFALSISRLDNDNVFCFADGILTMNVTKDMYYSIGIQGKKSKLVPGRFVIQINFLDQSFKQGSKLYDRVEWCFTNTLTAKHKFYLSLVSQTGQNQIINFPTNVPSRLCKPEVICKELSEYLEYPDFKGGKSEREFLIDSYEWIGLAGLDSPRYSLIDIRIRSSDPVDPFIAIYTPPKPTRKIRNFKIFEMRGFFAPLFIDRLQLSKPEILSVCGFEHSPLGFDSHENTYLNGGENDFAIVYLEDQAILYQAIKFFG